MRQVKSKILAEEYWKEYPNIDPEYVRWYPPGISSITPEEIWHPRNTSDRPQEIALYLHVPFCLQFCKYCPFNKSISSGELVEQYMVALEREIDLVSQLTYLKNRRVVAGYFGGGTPTTLTLQQLAKIVHFINDCLNIRPEAEMSIEANPDTLTPEKLRGIRQLGFNRISIGVQSFNNELLDRIGRSHSAQIAQYAIQQASDCGFDNICIDLIYGLPGQTLEHWKYDLEQAVELCLHQVTLFSLYVPPGTALYRETKSGNIGNYPNDELKWEMYNLAEEILALAGYKQYTAYDFALPGKASLHHAINWQAPQGEYFGLGPGAFSFIHGHIYANYGMLDKYINALKDGKLPITKGCEVDEIEEMSRFMVLGLKFLSVSKVAFLNRFSISVEEQFGPELEQLQKWDLIDQDTQRIWVTKKGKKYMANVSKSFYSGKHRGKPQPRV